MCSILAFCFVNNNFIVKVFGNFKMIRRVQNGDKFIGVNVGRGRRRNDVVVNKNPVNRVVLNKSFEILLVVGVKSGGDIFVIILRRFFPDIKGTIKNGLGEAIPKEARATISPRVVVPTPEGVLGEVGNTSSWILFLKEIKEISVFLRKSLTHRRRDEVAREGGRGVDEKK